MANITDFKQKLLKEASMQIGEFKNKSKIVLNRMCSTNPSVLVYITKLNLSKLIQGTHPEDHSTATAIVLQRIHL